MLIKNKLSLFLNSIIFFSLLASSSLSANSDPLGSIAKCQDPEGKWHYGDTAADACGVVPITIIDDNGRKVREVGVPMTDEEVRAKKSEAERKRQVEKETAKREREKKRILAIYPNEESVIRARDERIKGMDKNITLQEKLLDTMRLDLKKLEARELPKNEQAQEKLNRRINSQRESIDEYYLSISKLRREREQMAEKYRKILIEFKDLTGG